MEQQSDTIEVFCCYAHEDEHLLDELKRHLSPLQRQQLINVWYDRDISAGTEWEQEIGKHLNEAHIILLLISPDFIHSEYCYGTEMKRALERHKQEDARVIPIILRPVDGWEKVPPGGTQLGQLQALPEDAKPVTSWTNHDEAWKEVAEGIERVINELLRKSLMIQSTLPYGSLTSASIPKRVDQLPSIPASGVSIPHASAQQKPMFPPKFYSCFISYSSYDQDVAERLYTDLQSKGVRCWFAPHHMKIGDKIRSRIDESIRTYDKLLLILSKHSVASQWVETEVETAFEQERQQNNLVLFPIRIDETVMQTKQSWAAEIRRTRHIGDFTHWKDLSSYDQVFTRLLHDLEAEPFPGNMENGDAQDSAINQGTQVAQLSPFLHTQPPDGSSPRTRESIPAVKPLSSISRRSVVAGLAGTAVAVIGISALFWTHVLPFPSGIQGSTATPTQPKQVVQKWAFTTGNAVWSSPIVASGVLYVGSDDHKVYAIDVSTGQKKWVFPTGAPVMHSCSATVVNGVLYVGSADHKVYAIDTSTGQEKWAFLTGNGVYSSPTVVNGVLYIGSSDHKVYAINASTGQEKWAFLTGNGVNSPTVVNGMLYISSLDSSVYAIDASTGQKKWTFSTGAPVQTSSPIVVNGVLYVGSNNHKVYAIDASTGQKKWTFPTGDAVLSSPIVVNGVLYVGSADHKVYAIDASTGQEKWAFLTGNGVYSSPTVVNGVLYVSSWDSLVYAIDATTGQEKWAFPIGGPMFSSPTVVNGVLYVGSLDSLVYALILPG